MCTMYCVLVSYKFNNSPQERGDTLQTQIICQTSTVELGSSLIRALGRELIISVHVWYMHMHNVYMSNVCMYSVCTMYVHVHVYVYKYTVSFSRLKVAHFDEDNIT